MARIGRPRKDEGTTFDDGGVLCFNLSVDQPDGSKVWLKRSSGIPVGQTPAEQKANRRKAEAERSKTQAMLKASKEVLGVLGAGATVEQLAIRRGEERVRLGVRTADKETQRLRDYMLPHIGTMRVVEVRTRHLMEAYKKIARSTFKKGRLLSQKVLTHLHRDLCALFDYAIVLDLYVGENPAKLVEPAYRRSTAPRDLSRVRPSYALAEIERIVSDPQTSLYWRCIFAMEALAMVRAGEAGGIRVGDYDPSKADLNKPVGQRTLGEFRVARSYDRDTNKTDTLRWVPAHPRLAALLAEYLLARGPVGPEDLLFPYARKRGPHKSKTLLTSRISLKELHRTLDRLGLPKRPQHALRRAGSAAMANAGVSPHDRGCITHAPDLTDMQTVYDDRAWVRLSECILKIRLPGQSQESKLLHLPIAVAAAVGSRSIATESELLSGFCREPSERAEMLNDMKRGVGDLKPRPSVVGSGKQVERSGKTGKNTPGWTTSPEWFQEPDSGPRNTAPTRNREMAIAHLGRAVALLDVGSTAKAQGEIREALALLEGA